MIGRKYGIRFWLKLCEFHCLKFTIEIPVVQMNMCVGVCFFSVFERSWDLFVNWYCRITLKFKLIGCILEKAQIQYAVLKQNKIDLVFFFCVWRRTKLKKLHFDWNGLLMLSLMILFVCRFLWSVCVCFLRWKNL